MTAVVLPLRRRIPPETEPPFGDELEELHRAARVPMIGSLALPLEGLRGPRLPSGLTGEHLRSRHLVAVPDLDDSRHPLLPIEPPRAEAQTYLTEHPGLPDPAPWCRTMVPALVEVLAGLRPVGQLARVMSPRATEGVRRRLASQRASNPANLPVIAPVLRSLHLSEPAPGVVEACATVRRGSRFAALGLRIEGHNGRWQITAVQPGWPATC